ncbi:MAG: cofactor-independent phosphoglycerate mutase [Thermoguttaceae bacterium]|nr:cofactor-independent phosphoglycerate mutase [Thermoguttaceae bacterium]
MSRKYAIIIPDGCADLPIESLGGRTPLEAADIPNMNALAETGIIGRSLNVPDGFTPGSDVANLSLLGYNPADYYTGRAPLEAVAQGVELGGDDWAFRCNLVCLEDGKMKSFTAGHISSAEGKEIIADLQKVIAPRWKAIAPGTGSVEFFPGVSYRNLMVFRPNTDAGRALFSQKTKTYPPHDYTDRDYAQALPAGEGGEAVLALMRETEAFLAGHPVNRKRIADGKLPATCAWLWGQGKRPDLRPFGEQYGGIRGGMISAVDLLRGIAALLRWDIIDVPGITGYVDTDYAAKGEYAARALDDLDLVCVHVEATDESSHEGSLEKKLQALADIDSKVLPPILAKLRSYPDWRIFVSPDHPTPISTKTHSRDFVPWIVAGSDIAPIPGQGHFCEKTAEASPYAYERGFELMSWFTK